MILPLILMLVLVQDATSQTPRKPNPFAPSLPLLTDEEEEPFDRIIDRFILTDLGALKGDEAKKAVADFNKLGPEATMALIRGVNKSAVIEQSCPVLHIAKKLASILRTSKDPLLLEFARENIGAGIRANKHRGTLNELRVLCNQRRSELARVTPTTPGRPPGKPVGTVGPTSPETRTMTIAELAMAAGSERGDRLKAVLAELGSRNGEDAIAALGTTAASYEGDIQKLAREQLARVMGKLTPAQLKAKLTDDREEVRAAAARLLEKKK